MLGHYRPASKMQFKWRFAGRLMMARLKWYLGPLSPHQLKKTLSELDPLIQNFWVRAYQKHIYANYSETFWTW